MCSQKTQIGNDSRYGDRTGIPVIIFFFLNGLVRLGLWMKLRFVNKMRWGKPGSKFAVSNFLIK